MLHGPKLPPFLIKPVFTIPTGCRCHSDNTQTPQKMNTKANNREVKTYAETPTLIR